MENVIAVQGLTKCYNSLCAVDNISFEIRRAECFGFLGPNGAGKTTVMKIIYCYLPPDSGEVKVFGMDVNKEPWDIKRRIGVLPQDMTLDPDLSVLENLMVYARYFDIKKKDSLPRAWELLEFAEIKEKANVNILKLSGGMKRSLQLARALINRPKLLVLDEPTTGLDPHSRHAVWDKLGQLKAANTTLLLTTHYMEEAQALCDRVAIMDRGRIVTIDSPKHLTEIHGGDLEHVYLTLTGRPLET